MRATEFLYETIEVISEKTTSDELIPFLQPLGFKVLKQTANKVKVIVPSALRKTGSQQIASAIPGSTIERDGKEVHYDGATIEVKPEEAQGGRLEKEAGQIVALDSAIKEHLNGQPSIKLAVGTRVVDAAGVIKVAGNVKADAEIVDAAGTAVACISLKDGTTPKGFGQWGGINHLGKNPDVVKFVQDLKASFGTTFPRGPTYGMKTSDQSLQASVCFGKAFGGPPGISNVDLILQGHPTLKKGSNEGYVLTGAHTWHNGDIPAGEYEPVLTARFQEGRNDFGIQGARITAYPASGRPWGDVPAPKATNTTAQPVTPPGIQNQQTTLATSKMPMATPPENQSANKSL